MASKYDLVIFGATGFTGKLAASYVTKQYRDSIRWAIAGRSKDKLEAIRSQCEGFPDVLVADSGNEAALAAMVAQTKVVVSFAGPFSRYGGKLVAACASAGVDYCDITGETDWVREMIAKYDDVAKANGARIVSLCGHDSLPWDLMTFMLSKKLKEGNPSSEMKRVEIWDQIRSAPSGGTIETAMDIMFGGGGKKGASESKALGFDPLLKLQSSSDASSFKLKAQNVGFLEGADPKKGHSAVRTMFFMAGVNANTVKRSNALNGYGSSLVYREGQSFSGTFKACRYLLGLALFGLALFVPPLRYLLRKYVLPKPGEGPSEEFMKKGFLTITGVGTSNDNRVAKATMRFHVDPGYMDTARMAVESGLALSLDGSKLHNKTGGVLTPGACQGEAVLDRLLETGTAFEYH